MWLRMQSWVSNGGMDYMPIEMVTMIQTVVSTLLSAIVGSVCTLMGSVFTDHRDKKNKKKHAAAVLYYDLKSIEDYFKAGSRAVNIRYFSEWQTTAIECSFLTEENVRTLYAIYDLVYDYNCCFQLEKERGNIAEKKFPQYEMLKAVMFDLSIPWKLEGYTIEYLALLKALKSNLK